MATIDCRWIAFALLVCALAETPTAAQGHYEPSNVTVDVGAGHFGHHSEDDQAEKKSTAKGDLSP